MAFSGFAIFDGRTIDQENVHPSVVVVVEDGDAAAHGFHDVAFFLAAAGEVEIDSRGAGNVGEERWSCGRSFCGG